MLYLLSTKEKQPFGFIRLLFLFQFPIIIMIYSQLSFYFLLDTHLIFERLIALPLFNCLLVCILCPFSQINSKPSILRSREVETILSFFISICKIKVDYCNLNKPSISLNMMLMQVSSNDLFCL